MEQADDLLDGVIGFVVGGFEGTDGLGGAIRPMMEEAVGEGPAEPLVEQEEEQRHPEALGGETIRVAAPVAFKEAVGPELAEIVAELVEPVSLGGQVEGAQDGLVDVRGPPPCDGGAAVDKYFHEADHAGILNLDAGDRGGADLNRPRQTLEQRKVHVDIEPLGLVVGEAAGDGQKLLAHGPEVLEPFLQVEIREVVGAQLVAQEDHKLLVLAKESVPAIDPQDMMPLRELLERGVELPLEPFGQAHTEELGDGGR